MRATTVVSALAAIILSSGALGAQGTAVALQGAEIIPGARVRVRAPGVIAGELAATVLARTVDSVVLGGPTIQPFTLAISRLNSIEVSRGKSRAEGAIRGMKWGVPISIGFASLIAPSYRKCAMVAGVTRCNQPTTTGEKWGFAIGGGVLGGVMYGAPIGALIGAERWERVETAITRTSFFIDEGRPGIGMSVRF